MAKKELESCKRDVEVWCDKLGFDLIRDPQMPLPLEAVLFGKQIYIRKGMTNEDEIKAVGHEYAHFMLHAACKAYRDLDRYTIARNENQADTFAEMLLQ